MNTYDPLGTRSTVLLSARPHLELPPLQRKKCKSPQNNMIVKADQHMSLLRGAECVEDSKVPICVEVCLRPSSTAAPSDIKQAVEQYLSTKSLWYREGPIPLPSKEEADPYIDAHVSSLIVTDLGQPRSTDAVPVGSMLLFWQVQLTLVVYQLNEEEVAEDDEGEDSVASYRYMQACSLSDALNQPACIW